MKYFLAEADKKMPVPELKNWYKTMNPRLISEGRYHEIPETITYEITPNPRAFLTDIIDFPYFMIAGDTQSILTQYDLSIQFSRIHLFDTENRNSKLYLLPFLLNIGCLSQVTEYNHNQFRTTSLVMNLAKTGGCPFFRPIGFSSQTAVMHLEVAESLLRREIRGLALTEIELIE